MAATVLTVFSSSHVSGLDVTGNAVAPDAVNGNAFSNTGGQTILINNGSGSPVTLTKHYGPNASFDGTTPSDPTLSIAAGKLVEVGPFPPGLYNDVNGRMNFTLSSATSVTVLVRQLGT